MVLRQSDCIINSILLKISVTSPLPYLKIKCYNNTQHFFPKSFPLWKTQILDPWKLDCKCVIFSTQLTKSTRELSGCMWDGLQLCEFRDNKKQLSSKESFRQREFPWQSQKQFKTSQTTLSYHKLMLTCEIWDKIAQFLTLNIQETSGSWQGHAIQTNAVTTHILERLILMGKTKAWHVKGLIMGRKKHRLSYKRSNCSLASISSFPKPPDTFPELFKVHFLLLWVSIPIYEQHTKIRAGLWKNYCWRYQRRLSWH